MKTILLFSYKAFHRFFLLTAVSLLWLPLHAQQMKQTLKLADAYFAAGEYHTAAGLYGKLLEPAPPQPGSGFPLNVKRNRSVLYTNAGVLSTILFKQAESYRLSHNWEAAANCYEQCVSNNGEHRIDALFWLAVCQRNLGKFEQAQHTLREISNAPQINSSYKQLVAEENERLVYIRRQLTRPDTSLFVVKKLNMPFSAEQGAFAPTHIKGDEFIISSTTTDSLKRPGGNPYLGRLFLAAINQSKPGARKPVLLFPANDNEHQGAATISHNGKYLYYTQWKIEKGQAVSSIYYAVNNNGTWSSPQLLPLVNRNGYNSKQPFCSADGAFLYFASDRPGGSGKFDIWYAPLKADGSTGEPINAGQLINTPGEEAAPFYHGSSGTLVYASDALQGMGGYDLFTAKRADNAWSLAQNMGYPVNSVEDDLYFFAPENTPLLSQALISSDRGSGCCLQTFSIVKAGRKQILSGVVRDRVDSSAISNARIIIKNLSGIVKELTTDADGRYELDEAVDTYLHADLSVTKPSYKDVNSTMVARRVDEDDLMTEKWLGTDIYLEQLEVFKAEDVITVYFDFDRSVLKPEFISKLDTLYNRLMASPKAVIEISGYTDAKGSQQYNKRLSDKRAKACRDYLVSKGVDSSRIRFESFGSCCPVEMEIINRRDNMDAQSLSRRALIRFKK